MFWLLEKTICSILTFLILLTFKRIIGKKANPLWHYYIWFILFIQLLMPSLPKSNFNIGAIVPFQEINDNLISIHENKVFMSLNIENLVIIVWVLGIFCFTSYFVLKYLIFKNNIRKLVEIDEDLILFAFEDVKNKLKINRSIPIFEYSDIPMMVGFFKPVLLIPKNPDFDEIKILFYHELNHYKYFDTLINFIAIFTSCIFWFNPVTWYSFKIMQNDCEKACDYRVIKSIDVKTRKIYANVLVKYASIHMSSSEDIPVLGVPYMADSQSEIKKRIHHIISFKNYSKLNTAYLMILSFIISMVCLTKVNMNTDLITFIPPVYNKTKNFNHTFKTNSKANSSNSFNTTIPILNTNYPDTTQLMPPSNFESVMMNKDVTSESLSKHHSNKEECHSKRCD